MLRQYHLWIVAKDPDTNRPYLIYGAPDFGSNGGEDAARSKGMEMLGGLNFDIKRYPTRNLSEASAFHRGKRLEGGEGLKASTQRLGHEKSVARRLQRRRRLGL